jgi:hypothetical protein
MLLTNKFHDFANHGLVSTLGSCFYKTVEHHPVNNL